MNLTLIQGTPRERAGIPDRPRCSACAAALSEPFGWCSTCRAAYCLTCGRRHFCTPGCPANGCIAGLCVRLVHGGLLADEWGLPPAE